MAGITTDEIDLYVRSEPSLLANYCGVYAIDQLIDDFVKCAQKITTKAGRAKLPFAIVNTDPIDKSGTHWISLVKLQDESFFMFDSFGLLGFSEFIASDDRKLTTTFLTRFETYEQGNFKYYSFVFNVEAFLSLTKKQRKSLSDTCLGLMLFLTAFAVSAGTNKINIYGLVDQIQLRSTSTCGAFVLYFLSKIYSNVSKKICKVKTCTVFTIRDAIAKRFPNGGKSPAARIRNEFDIKSFIRKSGIEGDF